MGINCDCVNGTYVDHSGDVQKYGPRYDAYGSQPVIYDNMSFNGSLFDNSTFANTYGGMGCLGCYGFGYGGMYGMPYGGYGPYGGNGQNYYDWMYRNQEFNYDYNRRSVELQRENEMAINGTNREIVAKMDTLEKKIKADDQSHIKQAWDEYVEKFAKMYPQYADDPAKLAATAKDHFEQYLRTKNNDPYLTLGDELMKYAKPIFVRKLVNTATFGLFMKGSAEETARDITGSPMTDRSQNHASAGRGAGVITLGLGGVGLFKLLKNQGVRQAISRNWIVAGILAAGAIVGLVSSAKSE